MAKNDKTSKTTSAPSAPAEQKSGSKSRGFNRRKENAFIARTGYKGVSKDTTVTTAFKCQVTGKRFTNKSAYELHRKSLEQSNNSHTMEDFTNPTYLPLSEIRGDKYREANKRKAPWNPSYELQKQFSVVVDEETGRKELRWVTVTKYKNFEALLNDDGVDVLNENEEFPQYVDLEDVNEEGNDLPIIDDE